MRRDGCILTVMGLLCAVIGCSTVPADTNSLASDTQQELSRMEVQDAGLQSLLKRSYAYAIFPSAGKGALIAGGAYGHGEVFQKDQFIGYADMTQATVGLQAGGEAYAELLVFQDEPALRRFEESDLTLAADLSAVAMKSGAADAAKFQDGVMVFVSPKSGLMVEASVGGQSFSYVPATAQKQ